MPALSAALDGVGILARSNELAEGDFLLDQAAAYVTELGGEPDPGQLEAHRAYLAVMRDDSATAERSTRTAITQMKAAGRDVALAAAYGNLGGILGAAGRLDEAAEYFSLQLQSYRDLYGPRHAKTLGAEMNRAVEAYQAGRYADAEKTATFVLDGQRELGLVVEQAQTLSLLGELQAKQDRPAEAVRSHARVLALRRQVLPADHPLLLQSMLDLGQAQLGADDLTAAEATLLEARAFAAKGDPGALAYERVVLHAALTTVMLQTQRLPAALQAAEASVLASKALTGPRLFQTAEAHEAHGLALLALSRYDEASGALRIATERVDAVAGVPRLKARLRLEHARARRGADDEAGATALVQQARTLLDDAGDHDSAEWREANAL
ncbi:MAG: tetratricopeptide repeat protein [Myxococcota bacterium]